MEWVFYRIAGQSENSDIQREKLFFNMQITRAGNIFRVGSAVTAAP